MTHQLGRRLAQSLVIASCGLALSANAQNDASSVIEEVIVTATKIERNQQDVPVAVTAMTGDMMQEAGIKDMREIAALTPTLTSSQSQNSTTSSFSIRGIGTSTQNFGLESSVGIYIDGVFRSRQSAIINNLVDVQAVEVLRGPQGTLFGKNTPSGALNIRTVAPSPDALDGFFEVNAGDLGLLNVSGATNIPIGDKFALRATAFYGQRDGYVDLMNRDGEVSSDVLNDRDRYGVRLQAKWGDVREDGWDLRIIADHAEIDEVCCAAGTRYNNFLAFDNATPGSDAFLAQGLGVPVLLADQFDDHIMALNVAPRSTNEDSGLSAELNVEFSEWLLTSITAFRSFDSTDFIDADFSTALLLTDQNLSEQSSFSQEFRFTREWGTRSSMVLGLYYFQQDLDNVSTLQLGPETDVFLTLDPNLSALIAGIDGLSAASGGFYPATGTAFPATQFATDDMRQQHESFAIFGQMDFEMGENWMLTAGLRWTNETKDMQGIFTNDPSIGPPIDLVGAATTLALIGAGQLDPTDPANAPQILATMTPFSVDGWGLYTLAALAPQPPLTESIDDDQITGTLKLTWFFSETAMMYASAGTGYKSGGTNTDRIDPVFSQTFDAETSTAFEIGLKADFDTARLNIAVHNTQVEDLQTNAFSGTGFNLQNAGNADTYGAEIDFLWRPTDGFEFMAAYSYNVADFEDFENGTCWVATPFQTGDSDPGQTNPLVPVCDRSGGRVPSNPENRLFMSAQQDFRVGNSTTMFARLEYSYLSDTMTDGNNDPLKLRPSFDFINARVGVYFENLDLEVAAWGRNLTDERFYETVFDVPVQDGKLNAYPHEPLTWGVTARLGFGN